MKKKEFLINDFEARVICQALQTSEKLNKRENIKADELVMRLRLEILNDESLSASRA